MTDAFAASESPYARASRDLSGYGYHLIPIIPATDDHDMRGKAPGAFSRGRWQGMTGWQKFRDRAPSEFERGLWAKAWPGANVGIVLGTPAGETPGDRLIAVDVDSDVASEVEEIVRALPRSCMVKRGKKGRTLFYAAPQTIKSAPFDVVDPQAPRNRRRVLDLLTGFETRQTVIPPSQHPTWVAYMWLAGPVPARDLTRFDEGALEKLKEVLEKLGWSPKPIARPATPPQPGAPRVAPAAAASRGDGEIWRDVKEAALANLDAWVPALGLYKCEPARSGYAAVATWRGSATGRPDHERKRNLSIQPSGIRDFGAPAHLQAYTAIDLVMHAMGWSDHQAAAWLRDRLGMNDDNVIVLPLSEPTKTEAEIDRSVDERPAAPVLTGPFAVVGPVHPVAEVSAKVATAKARAEREAREEMPARLLRTHGLVGAIAEWITSTARSPVPPLYMGAALSIVGTAAGRLYAGPTRSGTHLYVIALAPSGGGKQHAIDQINRLMTESGLKAAIGTKEFMSLTAVANMLERKPLALCPMDEFGAILKKINHRRAAAHEQAITGILRSAWGASFNPMNMPAWAGKDCDPVYAPALSIYGTSTPREFFEALTGSDLSNGFLNRFLLISTGKVPDDDVPVETQQAPAALVEGLRDVRDWLHKADPLRMATLHNERADEPMVVTQWRTPSAEECYRELVREMRRKDGYEADFYVRSAEMALRIATIVAVGADPRAPKISLADMEWSRDFALWSADRMVAGVGDYMAETEHQADAKRVLRIIRERGQVSHQALVKAMQHRLKARDLAAVIESLIDGAEIVAISEPTSGRKAVSYKPAD